MWQREHLANAAGALKFEKRLASHILPAALPLLAAQASSARLSRLKAAPTGDPGAKLPALQGALASGFHQ
jgi:hypothetical protein